MGQLYWLGRQRAALANAKRASDAQSKLIHYDLAGRYSIKAAGELALAPRAQGTNQ
jgi:hypothetical protein